MSKKINEAQVRIDISDLQSSDLSTLARMMELAGQAEQSASPMGGAGSVGSIGGAIDGMMRSPSVPEVPDMPPQEEVGADMMGEPSIDSSMEVGAEPSTDPLQGAIDSLGGATDFGGDADMMESEEDDDEDSVIEEELNRMARLSGIVTEDDDSDDDSIDQSDDEEQDEVVEARIIPDLSLEEDADTDSTEYGPFKSEEDAVRDAKWKTNGELGDTFTVEPKEDGHFYWSRVMQEQAFSTEAEPEFADTDGIQYGTHAFKTKSPGTARGDNPLTIQPVVTEEEDEDESVDDIFESLQKKYNAFLGGK